MWPDRVSNPGTLALESDALPTFHVARPNKKLLCSKFKVKYMYLLCIVLFCELVSKSLKNKENFDQWVF